MNRRKFLQYAGASSIASQPAPGAQGRVRAGILGTGHSHTLGKLKAMQDSPDYDVAGICENDPAARARAQKDPRYKGLRWMSEQELLGDNSIHLIVVECRVWEALSWGKKVIDAGRHLHLEKPPGNTWAPFKELVEEARRKKLLLQTGYVWRCHEGINAALDAARKGWLGDVYMVRGTMNSDRGAEERAIEAKYHGGGLFELAGHVIDRTVELLGRPAKVQSWLRHDTRYPDTLADNNLAVFEFDKALAVISQAARMAGSGDHRSFEVIGTDGTIIVWPEASPPRMRVHVRKAQGPYAAGWQDINLPPQPRFVGDFKELARAIQTGQPLKLSYDHELLLQETLLRASGEL
ncbi:MAG: Gfo/Idh/MocA family oxidoreductase [Acidobacteriia bacterium]|nr:Gfo/Idh/MocA family oxidoreductase [Terriglobia bacterium]